MKSKSKNIPALRFPGFEGEWEEKTLGEVIVGMDSGWSPQCEEFPATDTEWGVLKTTAVSWEGFSGEENKKLPAKFVGREALEVNPKDILITRAGPRNRVGVVVHVDSVRRFLMLSDKIIRVRAGDLYSSKFISIQLSSEEAQQQIFSKTSGLATSQTNISQDILVSVRMSIPSLPEQIKIADFLSTVDAKLQALKQKNTALEAYKKGVMQKLFSQALRFKDADGKDFPDWEEKRLGEVFSFRVTNSYAREHLNYETGEVKNIHYGDIHTKFPILFDITNQQLPFINAGISISKISEENYCREGDLILADASEDLNDVGKSIEILNLKGERVLAGLHTILARPEPNRFSSGYIGYLFRSNGIRLQIQKESQGSKVLSISAGRLSGILIPIPSKKEQTKIAEFLSSLDTKLQATQQQIAQLEVWKKGLLQKMFV